MPLLSEFFAGDPRLHDVLRGKQALRVGSPVGRNEAVQALQLALLDLGFSLPASTRRGPLPDGIYGPESAQAVADYQRRNGLRPDGVVGPQTLQKLDDEFFPFMAFLSVQDPAGIIIGMISLDTFLSRPPRRMGDWTWAGNSRAVMVQRGTWSWAPHTPPSPNSPFTPVLENFLLGNPALPRLPPVTLFARPPLWAANPDPRFTLPLHPWFPPMSVGTGTDSGGAPFTWSN